METPTNSNTKSSSTKVASTTSTTTCGTDTPKPWARARPPLSPPPLPLPPLPRGGRGGARRNAHPAPPRCFLSRRARRAVADPAVDHEHLLLVLRFLLRLLHRLLLRILSCAVGTTAPRGMERPACPGCRHHPGTAARGGAPLQPRNRPWLLAPAAQAPADPSLSMYVALSCFALVNVSAPGICPSHL